MYPWYRDTQIGVGQFCSPVSATIKTETGFNDCMLAIDYAAAAGSQNKVGIDSKCAKMYIKENTGKNNKTLKNEIFSRKIPKNEQ